LTGWPEIQVRLVDEQYGAGGCSVAGRYDDLMHPPALCVARSASHRRRQFTVLHELGHHLQTNDIDLATTSLDFDDEATDAACDGFAARVLLPDDLVAGCFADRTPSAGDIVRLYQASTASRAACVVRAAEHLLSSGTVVLYDAAGVVSFAAGHGVYPPARGSDQSRTALVAAALQDPGRADGLAVTVDATTIRYRTHDSGPLYGQAAWCDSAAARHRAVRSSAGAPPVAPAHRDPLDALRRAGRGLRPGRDHPRLIAGDPSDEQVRSTAGSSAAPACGAGTP
jgi:hypothetical protein